MLLNRIRLVVPALGLAGALLAVTLAGAAPAASPPVGDWKMDTGSGTVLVDSSASGNNGTILGGPTWVVGQHGLALRLDGAGTPVDHASVPDSASLDISGPLTMAAWVKPEQLATQNLIKKAVTSGTTINGYELSLSTANKVFFRLNQATNGDTFRVNSTTNYPITGSTWMHVAATYDGTTMRLYVNGVQEGGDVAGPAAIVTNASALGIGAQPGGASPLLGALDDVLVYNSTLTASEIAALAAIPPPQPLVGDWKADEGSGSTLVNSSSFGGANNGTLLGNPTWVAGQHGQAIRFDGTGDYATVADNASLDISGAITLATWVKPEKTATQYLIKKSTQGGAASTDGYELSLASTGFPFVRFNTAASGTTYRVDSPTAYPNNGSTWMHLAATSNGSGGTIRLYVNGAEVATKPAPAAITTNNLALGIGGQHDGISTLQGAMDDILLYNTALTASEVAALATITPPNSAPTLNPVGDKAAETGSELAFTATASDPDAGDALTFSLAAGTSGAVPAGASITAAGAFTWTPNTTQIGTATFDVCVSDGELSDCETIDVTVTAANSAPELDPVGDKAAETGSELAFTATASDPDAGDALTFSLAAGTSGAVPAGASITAAGAFTWTPNTTQIGTATFDVCVSDGELSDCETIDVTVTAANSAPELDPVGDKAAETGSELAFTATASDPDAGDALTFSLAAGTSGAVPAGASITAAGAFTWTPNTTQIGTATFDVCVSDGELSDCETIDVTVTAANSAPELDPVGDKAAETGSELAFTATASDPDAGDALTFSLAAGTSGAVPAGASITAAGAFTWTPNTTQIGTATFDVCVSDGELSDCETIDVTVTAANSAPELDPVGDKAAETGSELAFTATASDPDAGDALTFSLAAGTSGAVPAGASITAAGAFTWTPNTTQIGTATFDVCVSDGELSDCETIDVTVTAANSAPELDPVGDKAAETGSELAFTATASDPDAGDALTFSLAAGTSGAVPAGASITAAGAFTWTPNTTQIGTATFDVCVSDGELSDCETIDVTVTAANSAPELDPVGDKAAETGSELAFTATASDPDAGDALTFSLAAGTSGAVPAGASITAAGAFTWTPNTTQIGTATFDVCVSDGELSDCETIDVTVTAANSAPELDPVGDKAAETGSELAFTATASDPDAGDALTFSLAAGTSGAVPAGASITAAGAFTWTPNTTQIGTATFDVCVSDGELSDCETIDVTVTAANSAPELDPVGDKAAETGSELAFTATASDPDAGDALTFSLAAGTSGAVPAGASITAAGAFTWTPNTTQIGTATFDVCVSDGELSDCETIDVTVTAPGGSPQPPVADFDGDGDTDVSVFRPSEGGWYMPGQLSNPQIWGALGDLSVPGDYDGNGTTDLAFYRPSEGVWYVKDQPPFVQWGGQTGDVPVPGDYDGNGTTDLAIYRASEGVWYVKDQQPFVQWGGQAGDVPVPGDYDGNGTTDIAIYRPSEGVWYIKDQLPFVQWGGQAGDVPVPGDYNGNGTTDIAIYRTSEGVWYVKGQPPYVQWGGQAGDVPVPGDYNGNGTTDIAIYRASEGVWYVKDQLPFQQWGASCDIPQPLPYALRSLIPHGGCADG